MPKSSEFEVKLSDSEVKLSVFAPKLSKFEVKRSDFDLKRDDSESKLTVPKLRIDDPLGWKGQNHPSRSLKRQENAFFHPRQWHF